MKDDYLWDKTGEADLEIQHLERVLGSLRHTRTSKDLPAIDIRPRPRPRVLPKMMAIAATLAFAVLALGVFIALQRQAKKSEANDANVAMVNPVEPPQAVEPSEAPTKEVVAPQDQNPASALVKVSNAGAKPTAKFIRRRSVNRGREAYENEQAEGLLAKERLLKALEITSSNLSVVQKKVRGREGLGPTS